jgi:uncharacterized membrane protein YbhN (UPF0104 family)
MKTDEHDSDRILVQTGAPQLSVRKIVVRGAVGVGLVAALVIWSDTSSLLRSLARADLRLIALAFVLMLIMLVVSCWRWSVFLRRLDIEMPARTLLRLYFVGTFFNAFLPTGVAGDAYKAMRLRPVAPLANTFASVLLDRIAGVVGLALIGLAAFAVRIAGGDRGPVVLVGGALGLAVLAGAAVPLVGERLLGRGSSLWFGLRPRLRRVMVGMRAGGRDPGTTARGLLAGIVAQGLVLWAHALVAGSLGLRVPVAVLAVALEIAALAAVLPITINGLGVREGLWVWALGSYGVSGVISLSYALLALGLFLATSAVGGLVYLLAGGEVRVHGGESAPEPLSNS